MLLDPIFTPFVERSPLSVLSRALIERALACEPLDTLFREHAQHQYTRDLLFSSVVDLMSLVVCGKQPSVRAAYAALREQLPVSLTSVYNKLDGIETDVSAALVRYTAGQLEPLLQELSAALPEPVPGYHLRILDGNKLAGTQHRLAETRTQAAAPLPGQTLAILEPTWMLITDVLPWEDAYAQERSLLDAIVAKVRPRDLWVADRNFCVQWFLLAIAARGAFFIIREHAQFGWNARSRLRRRGRVATGTVYEQRIWFTDADGGLHSLRRVVLKLDEPTREGETEIVLLTNLPEEVTAETVAAVYRTRWTIEGAFYELTQTLACEVDTLCYPKAALFAFCVAVVAYNIQSVLKGALRAVHGTERVAKEVSAYYLADEIAGVYRGMMIAIPPPHWQPFRTLSVKQFAALLRALASRVDMQRLQKAHSGPKKPRPKKRYNKKHPHVSTYRILQARKAAKQRAKKSETAP
jgi:Transposase DDE domain